MDELMQLVVGWTLVGAFVFTVIITSLSLVGWVRFADKSQQKRLFHALVIEMVLGLGSGVTGASRFNPGPVGDGLRADGANEAVTEILEDMLSPAADGVPRGTKEQAESLVDRLRVDRDPRLMEVQRDLRQRIRSLPDGRLRPEDARELRPLIAPARALDGGPGE